MLEENKAMMYRMVEAINTDNMEVIDELFVPTFETYEAILHRVPLCLSRLAHGDC